MKDQSGIDRGQCEFEDCICVEFVKPKTSKDGSFKCDYCEHASSQHKNTTPVKIATKQQETTNSSTSSSNTNDGWDNSTNNSNTTTATSPSQNKSSSSQPASRKEVATASSSKETKKKSLLDDLKNPSQMIKNATKQKKH